MNKDPIEPGLQTYPPWIVFDPDTQHEWVTPETLRYYVAHVGEKWFICDRLKDLAVHGTESDTRTKAIRKFYKLNNRTIPDGWDIPRAVQGTKHCGP
jgi:hypothetical protein